ncbi:MAG: acetoacetate decarboxylase [Deltaproteobacteria bacterium]|nr:acetoacetate decarboxylase [Deltaproteobacteria bacterium]
MGFLKTSEEVAKIYQETYDFYDAEMLTVFWETKPEIIRRLLPPPLKPGKRPLVVAFVANYPRTNFGVSYLESALFLRAEFNGEEGNYCLAMPVTNDMALGLGREMFGYPKKIGGIQFTRQGNDVVGLTERHGLRFFEVRAKLTGNLNVEDAPSIFAEVFSIGANPVVITYNFKYFPAPEGNGFDYHPRLIREEVEFRPRSLEVGEAEIFLKASNYDPWAEVEIVRVLGAIYTIGNNSMRKGNVVAEADPLAFMPYAFLKWDF